MLLLLFIVATSVSAQPIHLAWDNPGGWPVGTTVDLLVNGVSYPGHTGTDAVIEVPITQGQGLSAQARAVPPDTALCLASATQNLTLCKSATESTPECPLKKCEPSVFSNEVKVDAPIAPTGLKADVVWANTLVYASIWPDTAPSTASAVTDDSNPVNVGVRFTADRDGSLVAIKFYKAVAATDAHIATLWTSGGVKLATAAFTNETGIGWQTAVFKTPVSIASGKTYVASVLFPNGDYAYTDDGLATAVVRPPLTALANGVYKYSASSSFPNKIYRASNYWVDVVFTPNN
jgi:hypothetical protein